MEEEKAAGGDGDGAGGGQARVSSSFVAVGGRESFAVELRPGETTIVSWKKLVKDASKVKRPSLAAPEPPPSIAPVALEPSIPPEQLVENEVKDEPPASRFSAVIEKIERLYMGKHSSDEEDLNDIPDDDEYDTEDSFIDDAELDEYFQVDDSAIKHDGFFVNRGKLERINKPTLSPHQQPKKRRRKDLVKGHGENDDGHTPNKHVKVGKKAAGNVVPLVGKSSDSPLHTVNVKTKHCEDVKFQNQMNASEVCSKMTYTDNQTSVDPSPSKVSNGDGSLSVADEKDIEKRKTGVALSKSHPNKLKDGSAFSDPSHQRSHDKSSYGQLKSQSGKLLNSVDVVEHSVQRREKSGSRDRPEISVSEGKYSNQNAKIPPMQRKEGSSVRPKSTMLEKAIRELEKMVAESRPPAMEVQDADISSQTVKRRLPHEVKQKLAKVARLAQASHGKISIELINRLMSILGHLIQLRTLKRNLKDMVRMGLSAKQEKDDKFQQIKKEVSEMIKTLVASPNYKALDHPAGIADDFQEIGNEEKDVVKRKCGIDDALEEKICDLYDLYVEGLEEDAGPLVRKLYAELAELWPSGFMDNHGIKRAICRAKDRRRALYIRHKDQEKIKRKNTVATRTDEIVRVEASSIAQPQHIQEKIYTDSVNHNMSSSVSNTTVNTAGRMPGTQMNSSSLDRTKQEKVKGHSSNSISSTRTVDGLAKKKVKRKPELELGESQIRPEKVVSGPGEERHKSQKQVSAPLPSFEKFS